jgi:hypothetical protein
MGCTHSGKGPESFCNVHCVFAGWIAAMFCMDW